MARRKDACKSIPANLGLPDGVSLSSVRIFSEAKKRRSLNLITTLNSVGPRIHVFIFVRTGIPAC